MGEMEKTNFVVQSLFNDNQKPLTFKLGGRSSKYYSFFDFYVILKLKFKLHKNQDFFSPIIYIFNFF